MYNFTKPPKNMAEYEVLDGIRFTIQMSENLQEYAVNYLNITNNVRHSLNNPFLRVSNNSFNAVYVDVLGEDAELVNGARKWLGQFGEVKEEPIKVFNIHRHNIYEECENGEDEYEFYLGVDIC